MVVKKEEAGMAGKVVPTADYFSGWQMVTRYS